MPLIVIKELSIRDDKVKLVIELYKQNKNIREIAKEAHMSFGDISTIIKKEFETVLKTRIRKYKHLSSSQRD